MKPGGGEGGGGGGGGGAAGTGMRPGAPPLAHSGPGRAGPEAPPLLRPQPPPPTWFQRCAQAGPAGGGAGQGAGRAEQEVRRWRSAA